MINKTDVVSFFGGVSKTAAAIGVKHAAISQWPDVLSDAVADRAVAAAYRINRTPPDAWLRRAGSATSVNREVA